MKRFPISMLTCLFVLSLLILGCRGCPPNPNNNDTSSSPSPRPTATAARVAADSTIKRVEANVMAGASDPLSLLTDNEWHDLVSKTQVSTDNDGEARLKLYGCMTVYLFQTSKMTYAPCSKSESTGGNSNCQSAGTAVYNSSCASRIEQVIQTPTANITPKGTWITVTYLPDQQLTIILVLKGSAEVRPVIDIESRKMGEPTTVGEGQFYLTVPDARRDQNDEQSFNLRQAKNVSEIPAMLNKYLQPWLGRIKQHAEEDKIERKSYAFTADIDCDCNHVDAGLLTREYRLQCIRAEAAAWRQFYETGEPGKCDAVAAGPEARVRPAQPANTAR
ncbi:MAG: hypothetical protein ABR607_12465 [Pyrinomonadaceae bacterium]